MPRPKSSDTPTSRRRNNYDRSGSLAPAVSSATVAIEAAWHVLGDAALRRQYDGELQASGAIVAEPAGPVPGWRRHHAEHVWAIERQLGVPLTSVLGVRPPSAPSTELPPVAPDEGLAGPPMTRSEGLLPVSPLIDPLDPLEKIASWLAPAHLPSRTVVVPNVCGLHASEVFYAVAREDLRINFVRLTENPTGDGVVVDQDPAAGSSVRRNSTLTVQVVYPADGVNEI